MKKFLFILSFLSITLLLNSQVVLFSDDFESGITAKWTATGSSGWGTSSNYYHSANKSLTESPNGNYGNNWNTYCTMKNGVDLTNYPSASLVFWATYKIEQGFDYMWVEASSNNFQDYVTLATFSGNDNVNPLPPMSQYVIDLSGFCGQSNVKIRFHFKSDQGLTYDGMYIDDVQIIANNVDNAGPLIVHTPNPFYEGSLYENVKQATVVDFSGIQSTYLEYQVDGGPVNTVQGVLINNNVYEYTIPAQPAGSFITYRFVAIDNSNNHNSTTSEDYHFIAGNHIIQDNGQVDYYTQVGPSTTGGIIGLAVKITLGNTNLVGMLIRNYTDINNPNDSMLVHVWADNNGIPGNDIITPFKVFPAATLENTTAMTWIDLRPYANQLSNLTGTYYIGFTVPSGKVQTTITQPGFFGKSYYYTSAGVWAPYSGSYGVTDLHFRAITTENQDLEGPAIINNTIPVLCEASLQPQTVNVTILDATGVANATLYYKVDNGNVQTINGINTSGNEWVFTIPAQPAGCFVKYWITATDLVTPNPNSSQTDTFLYVSGVYHKFDNNTPNVYIPVGTLANNVAKIAIFLDFTNVQTQLTTLLIRNYYSISNPSNTPNNPMTIHVWGTNQQGLPANDLIPPFIVNSEAGPNNPMALTKVDLRPYANQLSNLTGSIFVGFSVENGSCAVLGDSNAVYNRTIVYVNNQWYAFDTDAQIRAVTSELIGNVPTLVSNIIDIYPNPATELINLYIDALNNTILKVYSLDGKELYTTPINSNNTLINVSNWKNGVYIFKIIDNNATYNLKVMKY
ncbi:MAG: T9SS type A sorting domain-containing protein [Bacteroidales bacterium]|nr:T9SS type A sorting domain-containing protein [Bacteroidales bacterium]